MSHINRNITPVWEYTLRNAWLVVGTNLLLALKLALLNSVKLELDVLARWYSVFLRINFYTIYLHNLTNIPPRHNQSQWLSGEAEVAEAVAEAVAPMALP